MEDTDVVANIFSFLPLKNRLIAEECCKLWREVSTSDRLVLEKFDTTGIKKIPEGRDEQILKICRHGVKVLLVNNTHIPPPLLEKIAELSPQLEELALLVSFRQATTASLIKIFDLCPKMRKLTLHRGSHIIQHDLLLRLTGCAYLEYLDLSFNSALSSRTLEVVAKLPLRSLNLQLCEEVTDEGIMHIAQGCASTLTSLNLAGCALITKTSCVPLGEACRNLTELNLDGCSALSNAAVVAFAQPNLKRINLRGSYWLTSRGMAGIASCCPDLEAIDLSRCSLLKDAPICTLTESCLKLREISIERDRKLTDLSVAAIASNSRNIRKVNLASLRDLTPSSLRALNQCSALEWLNISEVPSDDAAISALKKKFPNLELIQ